jgi:hypothetical protein
MIVIKIIITPRWWPSHCNFVTIHLERTRGTHLLDHSQIEMDCLKPGIKLQSLHFLITLKPKCNSCRIEKIYLSTHFRRSMTHFFIQRKNSMVHFNCWIDCIRLSDTFNNQYITIKIPTRCACLQVLQKRSNIFLSLVCFDKSAAWALKF